jgi:acyl dehydratase
MIGGPMQAGTSRVEPGATASRSRTVTAQDIERFTALSGDRNPIHYDEQLAAQTRFGGIVVQGGVTTAIPLLGTVAMRVLARDLGEAGCSAAQP